MSKQDYINKVLIPNGYIPYKNDQILCIEEGKSHAGSVYNIIEFNGEYGIQFEGHI